jgi:hypothetical protein
VSDVSVDPVGLRQVGAAVQSLGSRLAGAVPPGAEELAQPTGGGDGWTVWTAMSRVGAMWTAEVRALAGTLAATGDGLTQAANAYDQSDQQSAGRSGGARVN